ncbi:hypothetical protein AAHC03_09916 [Spirometra sp. Aus1]
MQEQPLLNVMEACEYGTADLRYNSNRTAVFRRDGTRSLVRSRYNHRPVTHRPPSPAVRCNNVCMTQLHRHHFPCAAQRMARSRDCASRRTERAYAHHHHH